MSEILSFDEFLKKINGNHKKIKKSNKNKIMYSYYPHDLLNNKDNNEEDDDNDNNINIDNNGDSGDGGNISESELQNILNEVLGETKGLANERLSKLHVDDWLYTFNLTKSDFPDDINFTKNLKGELELRKFISNLVNQYIGYTWDILKKGYIKELIGDNEWKYRRKLRKFWVLGRRKQTLLKKYKEEKIELAKYILNLNNAIKSGYFGNSIERESENIILKDTIPLSDSMFSYLSANIKKIYSFNRSWRRALFWLIGNIATNKENVKWLKNTFYEPSSIASNIKPSINYAFDLLNPIIRTESPSLLVSSNTINLAAKSIIKKSKEKFDNKKSDSWIDAIHNTHLFSIYQTLLIIATSAYILDLIGETDILNRPEDTISKTKILTNIPIDQNVQLQNNTDDTEQSQNNEKDYNSMSRIEIFNSIMSEEVYSTEWKPYGKDNKISLEYTSDEFQKIISNVVKLSPEYIGLLNYNKDDLAKSSILRGTYLKNSVDNIIRTLNKVLEYYLGKNDINSPTYKDYIFYKEFPKKISAILSGHETNKTARTKIAINSSSTQEQNIVKKIIKLLDYHVNYVMENQKKSYYDEKNIK